MTKNYLVSAPSNIALIKYMGKEDSRINLPKNGSISLTLSQLCTLVEIQKDSTSSGQDQWIAELPRTRELATPNLVPLVPTLSESGIDRVLSHIRRVRGAIVEVFSSHNIELEKNCSLKIRTANTFPAGSGIASSASSFAAMTLASAMAYSKDIDVFKQIYRKEARLREQLAAISRQGSGSSCRSFDGPWICWEGEHTEKLKSKMPEMTDLVLLISSKSKEISSSKAHSLVQTSPLWNGRVERVHKRMFSLREALANGNIQLISQIAWAEMWEMHSLFHTCEAPFTYWEPETIQAIRWLSTFVNSENPPIVTLDAGANVHILVQSAQAQVWRTRISQALPQLKILEDKQGSGALWLN